MAKPPGSEAALCEEGAAARTVAVRAGLHRQGLLSFVRSQRLAKCAFPLLKQFLVFMWAFLFALNTRRHLKLGS